MDYQNPLLLGLAATTISRVYIGQQPVPVLEWRGWDSNSRPRAYESPVLSISLTPEPMA